MMGRVKDTESGFSKYLRETLEEDKDTRDLFLKEVKKLPPALCRRLFRDFPILDKHRSSSK